MEILDPELVFRIVDVAAIVTNGLLGGAVARAFRFDLLGFVLLSVITGMGGGMIRDILLNSGLPVALTDSAYWAGALVAALLAYTIDLGTRWASWMLMIVDFIGMGCWVATGTIKSLSLGLHWLPSIGMGVITAVGGGMIRDVMVNRIPSILGGSSLYGTVAIVGAIETVIITGVFRMPNVAMAVSIASCMVLGILARVRNWQLPAPITLKVPRPRLRSKIRDRVAKSNDNSSWEPGQPLTENLQILTPEMLKEDSN